MQWRHVSRDRRISEDKSHSWKILNSYEILNPCAPSPVAQVERKNLSFGMYDEGVVKDLKDTLRRPVGLALIHHAL